MFFLYQSTIKNTSRRGAKSKRRTSAVARKLTQAPIDYRRIYDGVKYDHDFTRIANDGPSSWESVTEHDRASKMTEKRSAGLDAKYNDDELIAWVNVENLDLAVQFGGSRAIDSFRAMPDSVCCILKNVEDILNDQ